jgi:hypothetical protein
LVFTGVLVFAHADVGERDASRRLPAKLILGEGGVIPPAPTLKPVKSVKDFYHQVTWEKPKNPQPSIPSPKAKKADEAFAPLAPFKGTPTRTKAIIAGVAGGAGLAAVVGAAAVGIKHLVDHPVQLGKHKQKDAEVSNQTTTTMTTTTTSTTSTTTTTSQGDEIPMFIWIVLSVLGTCCCLALLAATIEYICKRPRKKRSGKKSTRRDASRDTSYSNDEIYSSRGGYSYDGYSYDEMNHSMYSTQSPSEYSSMYSADRSGYMEYSQVGQASFEDERHIMNPVASPAAAPMVYIPDALGAQASSAHFDPYSYAREGDTAAPQTYVQAGHVMPVRYTEEIPHAQYHNNPHGFHARSHAVVSHPYDPSAHGLPSYTTTVHPRDGSSYISDPAYQGYTYGE